MAKSSETLRIFSILRLILSANAKYAVVRKAIAENVSLVCNVILASQEPISPLPLLFVFPVSSMLSKYGKSRLKDAPPSLEMMSL